MVSENKAGEEMLKTVRRLLGKTPNMSSVVLGHRLSRQGMEKRIGKAICDLKMDSGTLLLTDLYGSSQFNACLKFAGEGDLELVTGFNLPMLVKLATIQSKLSLAEISTFIEPYGRDHVVKADLSRLIKKGCKKKV